MGKIISSRGDDTSFSLEHVQEIVYLLHETMGKEEEPADNLEDALIQLDDGVVDMSVVYQELLVIMDAMGEDLLRALTANAMMVQDMRRAAQIINSLTNPINDDALIDKAIAVLRREAQPSVQMDPDPMNPMVISVSLAFDEEKLREALRVSIEEYNNSLVQSLVI